MSEYLMYLLEVNGCFIVLYIIFYLFFRKLTFHKFNRAVLLLILVLSITIPLLPSAHLNLVPTQISVLTDFEYLEWVPEMKNDVAYDTDPFTFFNWFHLLTIIYWIGFVISLLRFSSSILRLFALRNNAIVYTSQRLRFFMTEVPSIFSFFNWVFVPKGKLEDYERPIIEHERAHAQLKHSMDVVVLELYIIACWFNPLIYLFRKSIRSIHEFQADEFVIKNQVKKSFYLSLLLDQISSDNHTKLYSYFNHPIIKKRVDMITKPNSERKQSFRYLLLMPALLLLVMAFTKPQQAATINDNIVRLSQKVDPAFIFPIVNKSMDDISAIFGIRVKNAAMKHAKVHGGIDIKAPEGEAVIATEDGIVSTATSKGDWGNLMVIKHVNGYETWYAHLQDFNLKEGQTVKKGEVIGWVGQTGRVTAPHLHYEIRLNGERLDPLDLMAK